MKEFFTGLLIVILVIAFLLGLTWLGMGNDFFLAKFFMPRMEQVRRETFEQSKAYNQGMIQELQNMQFEYLKTTDQASKDAMVSIILHRVADYNENKLPYDLRIFVQKLKNEKLGGN